MGVGLKGFLKMTLLLELSKEPQSGYQLIALIKEKTNGGWIPSKGAIYPTLRNLEEGGFIRANSIGARSKKTYSTTARGRKFLADAKKHRSFMSKQFSIVKGLILDDIEEEEGESGKLTFEICNAVLQLADDQKDDASRILDDCLSRLQKLPQKSGVRRLK